MRDVKFRIWHPRDKSYVELNWNISLDGKIIPNCGIEFAPESGCILEQFTGIRSISGKYVYEGDIVNIIDDGREYKNLTIKYSDKRCGFIAENEEWNKFLYKVEYIEIVGNVNEV